MNGKSARKSLDNFVHGILIFYCTCFFLLLFRSLILSWIDGNLLDYSLQLSVISFMGLAVNIFLVFLLLDDTVWFSIAKNALFSYLLFLVYSKVEIKKQKYAYALLILLWHICSYVAIYLQMEIYGFDIPIDIDFDI